MFGLGMPELIIILVIVLVIFGANRLPQLGEGLGKAIKGLKKAFPDITGRGRQKREQELARALRMKWVLAECDEEAVCSAHRGGGTASPDRQAAGQPGHHGSRHARAFLTCDLSLPVAPGVFLGMERAVARIKKAVSPAEKIVVYGDYDVDGVTGTALLYLVLKSLGAAVE